MSRTDSPLTDEKPDLSVLIPPPPVPMPDEVYERYKGPGELAVSVTRASILGTVGWYVGKIIGDWGAHDKIKVEKYKPLKGRTLGGIFAAAGTLMGLYSASRESREAHMQHHKLQRIVMEIHEENVELRHALHEAKVMLHVPDTPDAAPSASEEKTVAMVKPESKVQADSVSVAAMQPAEAQSTALHEHSARA